MSPILQKPELFSIKGPERCVKAGDGYRRVKAVRLPAMQLCEHGRFAPDRSPLAQCLNACPPNV